MGFRAWGLGFGVWGLGFRAHKVEGLMDCLLQEMDVATSSPNATWGFGPNELE